jgi:hypothetical protein
LYSVNSQNAAAKESALNVLGTFAERLPWSFHLYMIQTLPLVIEMTKYALDVDVQKAAVACLCQYAESMYSLHHGEKSGNKKPIWSAGVPTTLKMHPEVQDMITQVMNVVVPILKNSNDRNLVSCAINSVAVPLRIIGPAFIEHYLPAWLESIYSLLQGKHPSQNIENDEDDELNKFTVGEYNAVLIDYACELISETASALGPSFAQYYPHFAKLLFEFYSEDRTEEERSCCVGTFTDIVKGMKEQCQPHTHDIYTLFWHGLRDESYEVRVSACYGMGLLCKYGGQNVADKFSDVLGRIAPLFGDEEETVKDNAVACVARMILTNADILPMDQLVTAMVDCLPLTKDFLENEVLYECMLYILKSHKFNVLLIGNTDVLTKLINALNRVFKEKDTELECEEAYAHASNLAKALYQINSSIFPVDVLNSNENLSAVLIGN